MCASYVSSLFHLSPPPVVPDTAKSVPEYTKDSGRRPCCRFLRAWLENCSGAHDPTYGYKEGKPCVIIKLNRVQGFIPKA